MMPNVDNDYAIWHQYAIQRLSPTDIGRKLGMTQQQVMPVIRRIASAMEAEERELARKRSADFYNELIRRAYEVANLRAAPVAVGKDGEILRDPENDDEIVRDYTVQLNALKLAGSLEAENRKLLGLDEPTRAITSSEVKYTIQGVSTDELT